MNKNIWITGDSHYKHKNIVRGTSQYKDRLYELRDFNTLEDHDNAIVNAINRYVKENDILYHVGDWSLGGRENIKEFRNKIICKNIHICLGNHDVLIAKNCRFLDGSRAFDLFKSVNTTIDKKIHGVNFVMSHYAARAWHNGASGAINVHGDAHNNLKPYEKLLEIADDPCLYKTGDYYKQMDVGIDVAYYMFKEYRPFNIDEIIYIMRNRINLNVDHH